MYHYRVRILEKHVAVYWVESHRPLTDEEAIEMVDDGEEREEIFRSFIEEMSQEVEQFYPKEGDA